MASRLRKNFNINNRRTCISLEKSLWMALAEICERENLELSKLCSMIDAKKNNGSLTSNIRVFLLAYFKAVANDSQSNLPEAHSKHTSLVDQAIEFIEFENV